MNTTLYQEALTALTSIDPVTYEAHRNYEGGGTRLSVYITRGMLTLPQIRDHLDAHFSKSQNYKLIYELAWREYWQREWLIRGDAVFNDIKRDQEGVESSDLPLGVINGETGVLALDKGIQQLYETGYIHNHIRMWLSGLVCNIAHTKWQNPAAWMYYHLLDGDPASNTLSWQWVAGTFSSKRYLPSQENINRYTKTFQKDTFLDTDYEELAAIETPPSLTQRESLKLEWDAPKSDTLVIDKDKPTLLYHSFWLNREWRNDLDANHVLVLEPEWFEKFPVSQKVTESIIQIAREIPALQLYVGDIQELSPKLSREVYYTAHPSLVNWPGQADPMPLLFPGVPMRSFNSFTSYWKQCEKKSAS